MPNVQTIVNEAKRGCGFRKEGGLYLITDGLPVWCGKLPLRLEKCPTCGHGIKHSRAWTWIDAKELFKGKRCKNPKCGTWCALKKPPEKMGLVWIGERFYTPDTFSDEASLLGISRRIKFIPHGFQLGRDHVALAHLSAIMDRCPECAKKHGARNKLVKKGCKTCKGKGQLPVPGIFMVFKPQRIEYVVTGKESKEELERMEKRGITLVRLVRKA